MQVKWKLDVDRCQIGTKLMIKHLKKPQWNINLKTDPKLGDTFSVGKDKNLKRVSRTKVLANPPESRAPPRRVWQKAEG